MEKYPSKPPRLDSIFSSHECPLFFVTFNTMLRRPILASDLVHEAFMQYCKRGVEMNAVEVGQYVLMPDHIHLFVRGNDDFDLGLWIRGLKRAISKALPEFTDFWQPGFFDHLLRGDESYEGKWNYVRDNPFARTW
jgi:putative transposase